MEERLQPGTVILTIEEGILQVGTSPGHSFVLTHLAPEDERWLRGMLQSPKARWPGDLDELSPSRKLITRLLRHHGLLTTTPKGPDLGELRVRIVGLDRIGIPLARTLLTMGVTHLDLRDRRTVDAEVEYLFDRDDRGLPRMKVLQDEMRGSNTFLSRQTDPHLVISIEDRIVDHGRSGLLLSHEVSHFPIVVDDRSIRVGPLGIPSATCCQLCLDLHQTDLVPSWPFLREQLHRLPGPGPLPSPALALTAAGLAALLVESVMLPPVSPALSPDGNPGWYHGLAWRVFEGGVEEQHWTPHPRCYCQGRGQELEQEAG